MLELGAVFLKVTRDLFSVLKECRFICIGGKTEIYLEEWNVYKELAKDKNASTSFIKMHLGCARVENRPCR